MENNTILLKGYDVGVYMLYRFKYSKEKAVKSLINNNQIEEKDFSKALILFEEYLNKIGYYK